MKDKYAVHGSSLFAIAALFLAALLVSSCATSGNPKDAGAGGATAGVREKKKNEIPYLNVPSPQETIYSGDRQPLSFTYAGDDEPQIIYYPSPEARELERGGSYSAPVKAGTYYVLVRCEYEDAFAEYRILKAGIKIVAAESQEAIYNGNPKRTPAAINPPVSVIYSYYPKQELRDAAIKAAMESEVEGNSAQSIASIIKGYRRIETAPTEQGTYYVWIYFPGDENYKPASATVMFTILPPW